MKVEKLNSIEAKVEFNRVAKETGNIFNTLEWLDVFGNKVDLFGLCDNGGKIVGGFCLYMDKHFGIKVFRNPPFTPYIGPFLKIEAKNPVAILSKLKEAIGLMAETVNELDYSIISLSLNRDIVDTQPFIWKKFKVIPGYTYVLNLDKPNEEIWYGMSPERRNDIKKARKDGLIVKKVDDFKIVKDLVIATFMRQKKKINERYLNHILFNFANSNNSFAFVTFTNSIPISASFFIHDNRTAYYLLGGYEYKNRHHGAGALAMWESIQHAKSIGIKDFDLEGSMVPKIETYFRGFGGTLTSYFRVNKAKLPLEMLLKFKKRQLF